MPTQQQDISTGSGSWWDTVSRVVAFVPSAVGSVAGETIGRIAGGDNPGDAAAVALKNEQIKIDRTVDAVADAPAAIGKGIFAATWPIMILLALGIVAYLLFQKQLAKG